MSLQLEITPRNSTAQNYDQYTLANPRLLARPDDIPEGYIATNPSGIWTVNQSGETCDIMYLRIEPQGLHLGKSYVAPYIVDPRNPNQPLRRYDGAEAIAGEDPSLTRINRRLSNGAIEKIWLLSCVDAQPFPDRPDDVQTLRTKFYAGSDLRQLEHIADGPEWMKDIRIAQAYPSDTTTQLHIYGRPQPEAYSGTLSHATIPGIHDLSSDSIRAAPLIDPAFMPIGSGVWGGVNDVIVTGPDKNLLLTHRAWCTGDDQKGRHYQAELVEHNLRTGRIKLVGVLATADMFPDGIVKSSATTRLGDVVFPGGFGFRHGQPKYVTFGIRDDELAIATL